MAHDAIMAAYNHHSSSLNSLFIELVKLVFQRLLVAVRVELSERK